MFLELVFKSRSCLFPTIPVRPEKGYNWTDTFWHPVASPVYVLKHERFSAL
uniref:Uncharacterized protein n=1 Tax=Sinocyclocheilus rhinocerous TaxID=307959 RepID=A0A673J1H3_9TELE